MRLTTRTGEEKLAYSKEEREQALKVSLSALAKELGYTPLRSGNHIVLKEMDSLVIYNDVSWNRWSGKGNINSGSQIDFMLEFGPVSTVPEAINYLLQFKGEPVEEISYFNAKQDSHARHEMVLPEKNVNQKRLFAYLIQTRGLSQEIVYSFVSKKMFYEEAAHHNIVFCGYDPEGVVRYAGMRGTADIYGKKFKCDVAGNDKHYGVNLVNKESNELKVFESVIDLMSYIDMTGDNQSNKLVLSMVEDTPLEQFLKDYDHIHKITFCLDNDRAGQIAIFGNPKAKSEKRNKGLFRVYAEKGYEIDTEFPEQGKDWNECLLIKNGKLKKEENEMNFVERKGR